ncbi:MAG: glycosyltransferase family 39 protein, partial [Nitrosopumilus sp.]|nr:glycosyltransferase family 39 protein [Nitrosopumilus sp.]
LRINSLSIYKFYPDSYVPLIIAESIKNYGSVIGPLGAEGMLYPDFFGWTRPLYPLLILIFSVFTDNRESVAQVISFAAGILSIPLAYLYVSSALKSKRAGLLGALLLALSYNHSIWGGFILSDTTGVFFLLFTLWLLFRNIHQEKELADWNDLLTGAIFAIALLARYEYTVLIIPFLFLVFNQSPKPLIKTISISASFSVVLAATYFWLSPFSISSGATTNQIGGFVSSLGALDLSGLWGFIISDSILSLFFVFGIILLFKGQFIRKLGIFVVISIALLELLYYQTNPAMQRYFIHLIPFILLPASLGFTKITRWLQHHKPSITYAGAGVLCALLLIQSYVTYTGLRKTDNGLWFTAGYEAEAAKIVSGYLPSDVLLITSFPEPYYLKTNHSTHSIADTSPFVYISDSLDKKEVVIVEDEGMRQIFPEFTKFLHENMEKYKVNEIQNSTVYRYGGAVSNVSEPIRLYYVTLTELKRIIKDKS